MSRTGTISRVVVAASDDISSAGFTAVDMGSVAPHGLIRRIRVLYASGVVANVEAEIRRTAAGLGLDMLQALHTGVPVAAIDRGGAGDIIEIPYIVALFPDAGIADGHLWVALKTDNAGLTKFSVELHIEER